VRIDPNFPVFFQDFQGRLESSLEFSKFLIQMKPDALECKLRRVHMLIFNTLSVPHKLCKLTGSCGQSSRCSSNADGIGDATCRGMIGSITYGLGLGLELGLG